MSPPKDSLSPTDSNSPSLPDNVVLRVDDVSKKFCRNLKRSMWYGMRDLAANMVGFRAKGANLSAERRSILREGSGRTESEVQPSSFIPYLSKDGLRPSEFWALKDISFELKRGECLGLIGQNGCGKSTLLRLIAGIFPPDEGAISIRGRVGALIALGAGFHPHLTGRENVFLNGAILGVSQKAITRKFDEIVDFAEIGEFLDAPVSTYSSGMRVRLGFAVATAMEPDLLIIDEVLAVGDLGFVDKCHDRMSQILKSAAVVFVSHDMPMIARSCSKVLLIGGGRVEYKSTDVARGIQVYSNKFESIGRKVMGFGGVLIKDIALRKDSKMKFIHDDSFVHQNGDPLQILLSLKVDNLLESFAVFVVFFDEQKRQALDVRSEMSNQVFSPVSKNMTLVVTLPHVYLNHGKYSVTVGVRSTDTLRLFCRISNSRFFFSFCDSPSWAASTLPGSWMIV